MPEGPPKRLRSRPLWIIIGGLAVAFGISAYYVLLHWLACAVVYAPNHGQAINMHSNVGRQEQVRLGIAHDLRIHVGPPDASLAVWIMEPPLQESTGTARPADTVVLLHGIHGNKTHMLGMGKLLSAHGFRAVLVDLRGHGQSSGNWLTYGVQEAHDLKQVLDSLTEQYLDLGKVGVYGASYGAATAIHWAGIDPRIQAIVAVAPYNSLREIFTYQANQSSLLRLIATDGLITGVLARAGKMAGFDPSKASPMAAIRNAEAPLLLLHGKLDAKIPYTHSEVIRKAADPRGRLILLENEDHDSIMQDRNGILSHETVHWFKQWLEEPADVD